jgi:hypothetical protein
MPGAETLEHEIQIDETHALSFADISRILNGRIKGCSILYVDLETMKGPLTKANMLGQHDCACVLLTSHEGGVLQRHWTVLLKVGTRICFFDSLALRFSQLDSLLGDRKFTTFLKSINAERSTRKLQAHIAKIRTCGCWAAVRCAKFRLTNSQFVKWITSERNSSPDRTVVKLCYIGLLS